jgi:hypothetical protein
MPILRFEGQSDDTFGEVAYFRDDFDNAASGAPIEYLVEHGTDALIVTGQFCPGHSGSWLIGVANHDPQAEDRPLPRWPIRIEPMAYRNGYTPSLVIEAPEGVKIRCLQRRIEPSPDSDDSGHCHAAQLRPPGREIGQSAARTTGSDC